MHESIVIGSWTKDVTASILEVEISLYKTSESGYLILRHNKTHVKHPIEVQLVGKTLGVDRVDVLLFQIQKQFADQDVGTHANIAKV